MRPIFFGYLCARPYLKRFQHLIRARYPDLLTTPAERDSHQRLKGAQLSQGIWILLDHEGRVLRTGQEHFKSGHLRQILEKRYPGIRTSDMTATPVLGRDGQTIRDMLGQPFQLYCVWLVAGSPLPN